MEIWALAPGTTAEVTGSGCFKIENRHNCNLKPLSPPPYKNMHRKQLTGVVKLSNVTVFQKRARHNWHPAMRLNTSLPEGLLVWATPYFSDQCLPGSAT
eukprot:scaffold224431_cov17-Tisochrysis_lutea.AAC.4